MPRLTGKTAAVVGTFPHGFDPRTHLARLGATVVDIADRPDVVLVGDGRGGKPPASVAKALKKNAALVVVNKADVSAFLLSPEECLEHLRSPERDYRRSQELDGLWRFAVTPIDLSGADLRRAHLRGERVTWACKLDRADFTGADAWAAWLASHDRPIVAATFDGANLDRAMIRSAVECSFREAVLTGGDLDQLVRCDFTAANMAGANLGYKENVGSNFRGANLSRARSYAAFTDCDFTGANLADSELTGRLEHINFTDADLTRIKLGSQPTSAVNLTRANLTRASGREVKLDGAVLVDARVREVDFPQSSFRGADLRGADLRHACLTDADFTGANLDGADFTGAYLRGATLPESHGATGVFVAAPNEPGPAVVAMEALAAGVDHFATDARGGCGGEPVGFSLYRAIEQGSAHFGGSAFYGSGDAYRVYYLRGTLAEMISDLRNLFPGTRIHSDTVTVTVNRKPAKKLLPVAVAAWLEAFGPDDDAAARQAAQAAEAARLRVALIDDIRARGAGAHEDARRNHHPAVGQYAGADFSGANLAGVTSGGDFTGANLRGVNFSGAALYTSLLEKADLSRADLRRCHLTGAKAAGAVFAGADLTGALLEGARLEGADLTGATLTDARLAGAIYDHLTRFPDGFTVPDTMRYVGPPREVASRQAGSLTEEELTALLNRKFPYGRIDEALGLIRRRILAAWNEDGRIYGVVRGSERTRRYACALTSEGDYGCLSDALNACGGQSGRACKHLLALVLREVQQGRLDPATAAERLERSLERKPSPDTPLLEEALRRQAEGT